MAFLVVFVIAFWKIRHHVFAQTERDVAKSCEDTLEETGSAKTLWNYSDNTEFCTCSGKSEIRQSHTSLSRQMSFINFTPKKRFDIKFCRWSSSNYEKRRGPSICPCGTVRWITSLKPDENEAGCSW